MKKLYILCLLAFISSSVIGQGEIKLEKASDYQKSPDVSAQMETDILALVEQTLNEYAVTGKMFDEKAGAVTNETMNAYNQMFSPTAEVVRDFVEFVPRDLMYYKDYSIEVFNFLNQQGVEFFISKAVLKEITVSTLGSNTFYIPVVEIEKLMFSNVNPNNGVINRSTTGVVIDQLVTFDIFNGDLSKAAIAKIDHATTISPPDDYNRIIGIYAQAGSASYSYSPSSYWNDSHEDSDISIASGINWGIGIDFMSDQYLLGKTNSNRFLGWSAGLRYSQVSFNTEIRNFTTATMADVIETDNASTEIQRFISLGNMDEKISVGLLSIPIGLDYKVLKSKSMIFALHARVVPSIAMGSSSTTTGVLLHDVYIPSADLLLSDANSGSESFAGLYDVGSRSIDAEGAPELAGASVSFEFSPAVYFNFDETDSGWGLYVGLDVGYRPSTYLVHNSFDEVSQEALKLSSDLNSPISSYTDDFSAMNFGIRIGLFQRTITQP